MTYIGPDNDYHAHFKALHTQIETKVMIVTMCMVIQNTGDTFYGGTETV